MPKISVIIATYNRCESLKDTLEGFFNQKCDGNFDYEIIVVDNNSKDKTREIIKLMLPELNGRLRYLFEPIQGKSFALNRGIKEAKGEIITFIDDDCIPEKSWLFKIQQKFIKNNDVDIILGGVVWENGKLFYSSDKILRGNVGNSGFRKQIFKEVGFFDIFLGPGSIGCSAEDIDYIYRAKKQNKKIIICNEITVIHKQRASKESLKVHYRYSKGTIIFWLKFVLKEKDIFALKKIYWSISGIFLDLFNAIKIRNKERIKVKVLQISGATVGLIKGFFIWSILYNFKKLCQKLA